MNFVSSKRGDVMKNRYFTPDQSLYDITSKYPETIPVFVSKGFSQLEDEKKRESFRELLTL